MITRTAVLTVPLSLLACATPADRVPTSASTVVNAAPDAETSRWRLSAEPVLSIGREGDPRYEFFRPQQALSLSDGRIVVSNAFHEVRYYHSNGTYQMTAGREGRGPGEFTHLMTIHVLPGDSVAAKENRDGAYEEMIVFDPHGRMARADARDCLTQRRQGARRLSCGSDRGRHPCRWGIHVRPAPGEQGGADAGAQRLLSPRLFRRGLFPWRLCVFA